MRTKIGKLKELYLNDLITLEEYKADQASYNTAIESLTAEAATQEKPNFEAAERLLSNG